MIEIDGKEYDESFVKMAIGKQTAEFVRFINGNACCPSCGEKAYHQKYCDKCGQKLKVR